MRTPSGQKGASKQSRPPAVGPSTHGGRFGLSGSKSDSSRAASVPSCSSVSSPCALIEAGSSPTSVHLVGSDQYSNDLEAES